MIIANSVFTIALFITYLALWYIKRKELFKTEGAEANVLPRSTQPTQKYFAKLERILTGSIVLIIPAHLFFRNQFALTAYLEPLDIMSIKITGFLIGIAGLAICRIAQVTIGKSWRVGIDNQAKTGLITHGIYRLIRNPTYTGLFILCAGIWLLNPTYLYGSWILLFILTIEFQVRCEEEYLTVLYGNQYLEYLKRTKRYFPFYKL